MEQIIYMDYAATTPVDPRVAEDMMGCLTKEGIFGNPASLTHTAGKTARSAVEAARAEVAELINAEAREIIWTSGATESNNLAIKGAAHFHRDRGRHIITSRTEHKAVLDSCRQLEREGFEVTYLTPEDQGLVSPEQLTAALRDDTILVSLMHVNNETGVIQDIGAFGAILRERGILFHVDAAQSAGKVPIDLETLPVDLMSFSAHKVYGPKGAGALYVRKRKPRARIEAQMHGGGHEHGMRSGTLATHQIVGMGKAFKIAGEELDEESRRITSLRQKLWQAISALPGVVLNGDPERRAPGILNVSFCGVDGESLMLALDGLAVSGGSACNTASQEASYVLRALGRDDQAAQSAIRFSLGRFSTEAEIDV
ncbi:MAG: IscS subfamily cysteine desulfurase, partial [Gammaproteobacteria bacterium]|nr:IscS subfamily cysteine desulfurase [Gammaproteobacteria bacterium]